jgi:hypothetical protein
MIRSMFACYRLLLWLGLGMFGQVAKGQQPSAAPLAIDSEYRKFDDLVSFVRARNAERYAILSPKGIDEGSFVKIGGIEQWITIRGQDRGNPVLLFLHGGPGRNYGPDRLEAQRGGFPQRSGQIPEALARMGL